MPSQLMKICQACKIKKPLSDFYHNSTKNDKHNGVCKECQLKINKKTI